MLKFKPGEFAYLYYSQLIVIVGPVCNAVRLSFSAGFASARDLIKSPLTGPEPVDRAQFCLLVSRRPKPTWEWVPIWWEQMP